MVCPRRRRADNLAFLASRDDERARSAAGGTFPITTCRETFPLTKPQVRATERLYAAERAAAPTGVLAMDALGGRTRAPDVAELRAVWNLQRFAETLESHVVADDTLRKPEDRDGEEAPEEPARMDEWRRGFRKTTYLTLAVGAALAGVYQAPLRSLTKDDIDESSTDGYSSPRQPEVLAARWPALQTLTTPAQDAALFGDLGAWLLRYLLDDDRAGREAMADRFARGCGRAKVCRGEGVCDCALEGHSHADAHHVVWELVKVLWMAHKIHAVLDERGAARRRDERQPSPVPGRALVAPLRYFVTLSVDPDSLLAASTTNARLNRVFDLVEGVNSGSEQMTHYEEGLQIPPLWAKFFVHFLQRHLDLAFDLDFFDQDEVILVHTRSLECAFMRTLGLFALDTVDGRSGARWPDDLCMVDFLNGSEILEPAGREVTYYN